MTKVIESQVHALNQIGREHFVLSGEHYTGETEMQVAVFPQLNYHYEAFSDQTVQALYSEIKEFLDQTFPSQDLTFIIHNPTLGKSTLWPALYGKLINELSQDRSLHFLLQCHDFAEDGRPENYQRNQFSQIDYPTSSHIHYGFINSRDQWLLTSSGLPSEQSHFIPNEVTSPALTLKPRDEETQKLVLYPARGIRRKNVGEFCLWSALAPAGTQFALTLAPENEAWKPLFNEWKKFAKRLELPVILGCVNEAVPEGETDSSYLSWLNASSHIFTTSIAEGFGLSFLEPIMLEKPLLGRDLPLVTLDFVEDGLELGSLYQKLLVPESALDLVSLRTHLKREMQRTYSQYGQTLTSEQIETAWQNMLIDGFLDFGNLPESIQQQLIERHLQHHDLGLQVLLQNEERMCAKEWISQHLSTSTRTDSAHQLEESYSTKAYQERLASILSKIENSPLGKTSHLEKSKVLYRFLSPARFHFLRT